MVVDTKGEIGAVVPSKNNLVGYPLAVIATGRVGYGTNIYSGCHGIDPMSSIFNITILLCLSKIWVPMFYLE